MRVAVVGASGFVGRHVCRALSDQGHEVVAVRAPRFRGLAGLTAAPVEQIEGAESGLAVQLFSADAVINAAGDPDASSSDIDGLLGANATLPGVLAQLIATRPTGPRFIHVSSAVVQGRLPMLDASCRTDAFSAYAKSKVLGEEAVARALPDRSVIYRPPSVHAGDRRVSSAVVRLAESPLRSVAGRVDRPSPQALVENVASAIAYLATTRADVPPIVIHPWEGVTTRSLMRALGGKDPRVLPEPFAKLLVSALTRTGRHVPSVAANARRVEMMWFGQAQDVSWLTESDWRPAVGPEGWSLLREQVKTTRTRREVRARE